MDANKYQSARQLAARRGAASLKEFDRAHKLALDAFWGEPTAADPARAKQLDKFWGIARQGVTLAKLNAATPIPCDCGARSFDRSTATVFKLKLCEGDRDRDGRPMAKQTLFSTDMKFSKGNRAIPILMGGAEVGEVTATNSRFAADRRMELEFSGVATEPARRAMSKGGYCFMENNGNLSLEICG